MKYLFYFLLLNCFNIVAQVEINHTYPFLYRLQFTSSKAFMYMEFERISWVDTNTSTSKYLDTVQYDIMFNVLNGSKERVFFSNLIFLDSNKEVIETYENNTLFDSILLKLPPKTMYISFENDLKQDTVLFYFQSNQVLKKITLVGSQNGDLRPLLKCKRKLSTAEMSAVYEAIRLNKRPKIEQCGICQLMFEL